MPKTILTDSPIRKAQKETHTRIKDIPAPEVSAVLYNDQHLDAGRGLYLKVEKSSTKTWVLAYYPKGKRRLRKIGDWPKMGPAAARNEAGLERDRIAAGKGSLETKEAEEQAAKDAEVKKLGKADLTLGNLLLTYVAQLEHKEAYDSRAVKNSLIKNVKGAHRDKWDTLADELTMPDFRDIVATLVEAEKYREAQKVRAYMVAAYAAAIAAPADPTIIEDLQRFKIKSNPARDTKPPKPSKQKQAKTMPVKKSSKSLSLDELRAYWKRINALPDPDGAVLRLHLLTGGQRLRQLCRLTADHVDGNEIILLDSKGRREEVRIHVIPLLPEAKDALEAIDAKPWLVSFDGGNTPANPWHVSMRVKAVAKSMLEAGEIKEVFTGKLIRSTVRTRLKKAGIRSGTLDLLLSHNLGGVGAKHYEEEEELRPLKTLALETLHDLLNSNTADVVVPMKRKAQS